MESEFEKVQFYHPDVGYENLWAAKVGKQRYKIQSIPFFIYGVSPHDVVIVAPDSEGRLQFHKVVERSGNRVLRARSDDFIKNATLRKRVIAALEKLGCGVEVLRSRLLAINVPEDVDLEAVKHYLTDEAKISWEHGNPPSKE